jgi:ribosomal protein L22
MNPPNLRNFWNKLWSKRPRLKGSENTFTKMHELKKPQPKPKVLIQSFWLKTAMFKCSAQKLSLLANQITLMKLIDAINQMQFSPKKASRKVYGLLMKVKKHIETYSSLSPAEYFVRQALVGRGKYTKEIDIKAKGRFGVISHPNSFIRVEVAQWVPKVDLVRQLRKAISKSKRSTYSERCNASAKINY